MATQPCTYRFSLWLFALSTLVLLASNPLQAQPASDKPKRVFRVEAQPPEVMFKDGIISDGNVFFLLDHVLGRTCNDDAARRSAWISTTSDRVQAEQFLLRQLEREHATQTSPVPAQAWLYEIRTDHSYVQVESVLRQVIQAGRNNRNGYSAANAEALEHLLSNTYIRSRAEVLTNYIRPRRIISAQRATYAPDAPAGQRLVWSEASSNANFQEPTEEMDNLIDDLHNFVPLDSPDFANFATRGSRSCFQTCDGASTGHRFKRSLTAPSLSYCPIEPSDAEVFIGSEE
ncbi:hypothetical protein ACVW0Y_003695 [Pseudomonas sp. TE3786]